MRITQSDTTITLAFSKRLLVICLIAMIVLSAIIAALFSASQVRAAQDRAAFSAERLNSQHFFSQPIDCLTPVTALTQAFNVVAKASLMIFSTSMLTLNEAPVYDEIITDFSSTYTLRGVTTASSITSAGCAQDDTRVFNSNDRIYVVMRDSDFQAGTTIFARLSYNGEVVADSDTITAEQDYRSICANLWFEDVTGFDSGEYTIDLYINARSVKQLTFEVR